MVPSIAKQLIREYIYAYSAISPQTGDCFSIISPVCNTEAMNVFLNLMAQEYHDYRMVILLDKAGWHTSSMLELPANIKLMHLTPYSPELNPVELLWREVRAKYFHNQFFNSLDDVEKCLCKAMNNFNSNHDSVKQLSNGYLYFNKIDGG